MGRIARRAPHYTQPQGAVALRPDLSIKSAFSGGNYHDITRNISFTASGAISIEPNPYGLGFRSAGSASNYIESPQSGNTTFTIFAVVIPKSATGTNSVLDADRSVPTDNRDLQLKLNTASLSFIRFNTAKEAFSANVANAVAIDVPMHIVAVSDGTAFSVHCQAGAATNTITSTPSTWDAYSTWFARTSANSTSPHGGNLIINTCGFADIAWGNAEIQGFIDNPWQIFKPRKQVLYFDAGGAPTQALVGDASAQAAASAALSLSVPLAGASVSLATASGAVSVSIPLAGAATNEASAAGDLSVSGGAALSGNATATANASGGVSLSIPLSGSAVAQALASAGLSLGVDLAGAATADATGVGTITLNIALAGAAIAEALASGALTTDGAVDLAGNAMAAASASGPLSVATPLDGYAASVASAGGGLSVVVPLEGAAAAASTATGGLDVTVAIAASALATAAATGDLSLVLNLNGAAVALATASGLLRSDGVLVGTPGWQITRPARDWKIARPARDWKIARPARDWRVAA